MTLVLEKSYPSFGLKVGGTDFEELKEKPNVFRINVVR
jgi:hypothetical protein